MGSRGRHRLDTAGRPRRTVAMVSKCACRAEELAGGAHLDLADAARVAGLAQAVGLGLLAVCMRGREGVLGRAGVDQGMVGVEGLLGLLGLQHLVDVLELGERGLVGIGRARGLAVEQRRARVHGRVGAVVGFVGFVGIVGIVGIVLIVCGGRRGILRCVRRRRRHGRGRPRAADDFPRLRWQVV